MVKKKALLKAFKEGSIIIWRHVKFYGEYDFSVEKLKDSIGFNLPEIVGWRMKEKREQTIPLKSIETEDYQNPMKHFYPSETFNHSRSDSSNGKMRSVSFGYYRFDEVSAGQTVGLNVQAKRYQFAPQVPSIRESLTGFALVALFANRSES